MSHLLATIWTSILRLFIQPITTKAPQIWASRMPECDPINFILIIKRGLEYTCHPRNKPTRQPINTAYQYSSISESGIIMTLSAGWDNCQLMVADLLLTLRFGAGYGGNGNCESISEGRRCLLRATDRAGGWVWAGKGVYAGTGSIIVLGVLVGAKGAGIEWAIMEGIRSAGGAGAEWELAQVWVEVTSVGVCLTGAETALESWRAGEERPEARAGRRFWIPARAV